MGALVPKGKYLQPPYTGHLQKHAASRLLSNSELEKQNQNTRISLNRLRSRILPLKCRQPGHGEGEGRAKRGRCFGISLVLVQRSMISSWENKRWYWGLTQNRLWIASEFLQHATKSILDWNLQKLQTRQASANDSLTNTYLNTFAKESELSISAPGANILLLQARSRPRTGDNYPSAPTLCLRAGRPCAREERGSTDLSTPAGSALPPSRSSPHRVHHFCALLRIWHHTPVQAQSDIYS